MNTVATVYLVLLGVVLAGALLWYLLWLTEGMYLGWRVVALLYDWYASRYDRTKHYDATYENWFLGRPVVNRMKEDGVPAPLILDVATGTGRLPWILLEQSDFNGRVVGLDISRRMLFHAAVKLYRHNRYDLIWHTVEALPFADGSYDMVTCLEAWEFFPHAREDLAELVRVLRPGGTLFITNRTGTDARMMPGKTLSTDAMADWLRHGLGLVDVEHERWQVDYDLFWARKPGESLPAGARLVEEILRCPVCGHVGMLPLAGGARVCPECEARATTGDDGVIETLPLWRVRRANPG